VNDIEAPRWQKLKQRVLYVATHYTWAFVIIMAVTVISCAFSINYLATLEANLNEVYENDVRGGDSIQAAYTALLGIESTVKDLVLFPDRRTRDRTKAALRDLAATLKASSGRAAPRFHTPKARLAMLASQDDQKDFLAVLDATLALADRRPMTAGDLTKVDAAAGTLEKDFDLLLANRSANSNIGISELVSQLRFSLVFTIVLLVVTVIIRVVIYLAGHPKWKKASDK